MKLESWVYCSFSFEGLHCWKDAIHEKGVEFLALKHRHMFHVKLRIPVDHHDRDIEFIKLKRYLKAVTEDWPLDLHGSSCESIAFKLALASQFFINSIPKERMYFLCPEIRTPWNHNLRDLDLEVLSKVEVEVSEDNENGAVLRIDFRSQQ